MADIKMVNVYGINPIYTKEKEKTLISGWLFVFIQIAFLAYSAYFLYHNWDSEEMPILKWVLPSVLVLIFFILFAGYVVISPNEAAVLVFAGKYKGTLKSNGFWFANPFYGATMVDLKVLTIQTGTIEVNEKTGCPIEIAAVVNFQVIDTYSYVFGVTDVDAYIHNQAELSLRGLAKSHTYTELSGEDRDFIQDLTESIAVAGLQVKSAKISQLNYAETIAAAMLQKQQAQSMSEAKQTIVENAIGIAKEAAKELTELTPADQSRFISSLIIVLCGDRGVSPVLPLNQ